AVWLKSNCWYRVTELASLGDAESIGNRGHNDAYRRQQQTHSRLLHSLARGWRVCRGGETRWLTTAVSSRVAHVRTADRTCIGGRVGRASISSHVEVAVLLA